MRARRAKTGKNHVGVGIFVVAGYVEIGMTCSVVQDCLSTLPLLVFLLKLGCKF